MRAAPLPRPQADGQAYHRVPGAGAGPLALWAFILLAAVVTGLAAISANPIVVVLVATLIIAPALIAKPQWSVWAILVAGLLVVGVVPIWAEGSAGKAVWALSALSFLLLAVMLVRGLVTPGLTRDTPTFVWVALAFMLYAVVNSAMQLSAPVEAITGAKRYFQAFGLLLALCWLPLLPADVQRWRQFFVVVALLQLPWTIYERVQLVPIREGFKALYPGLVPVDVVAGTFGANMYEGGANGAMAAFMIFMLAFLLARWRAGLVRGTRVMWLGLLFLMPLFMGETKVVVVLLPLMFVVLYRRELLRRPHVAVLSLLVGAMVTVATLFAYVAITKSKSVDALVADTVSYNFQDRGLGSFRLNRTTVLSHWAHSQSLSDPVSAVVGHGLGSAHDATAGHMARRHAGAGIGITAASTLLWDLGAIGLLLYMGVLALAWGCAGRLARTAADATTRADCSAIQAVLAVLAIYVFYRKDLLEVFPFQIVLASLLGYLCWMHRQQAARFRAP